MEKQKPIYVVIEGGIVQAVCTHDEALIGRQFVIVDYDIEGAEDDQLHTVKNGGGEGVDAQAWVSFPQDIGQAGIEVPDLCDLESAEPA